MKISLNGIAITRVCYAWFWIPIRHGYSEAFPVYLSFFFEFISSSYWNTIFVRARRQTNDSEHRAMNEEPDLNVAFLMVQLERAGFAR